MVVGSWPGTNDHWPWRAPEASGSLWKSLEAPDDDDDDDDDDGAVDDDDAADDVFAIFAILLLLCCYVFAIYVCYLF